ncbi:hypothetical protein EI77_01137 [Prosthecobacter fusiformis]|uniref:GTPase-associated protein 1 N-terminal domain-containing protein n=1 Tax=Prosthecobacter fusiformis TaxID=48464 RepID=A0A4R7SU38_9BACT|nr:hypothetical protein [Prosthecobacter fusiformis]TDU81827.1 hypothetical protein EI77_01137 [Prosthecobacter fusiformis]
MAWQLIYTSAPRLLEAGRTGFGTVARHRAVSGTLASAIERFSQFARQPGHDLRRIIYSHRIVLSGASRYHVLSCIRDSGSDYTGRTSHIAHHLIAEAMEVRSLAASGITPADVLLAMKWRTGWNDPPRFLDPADEVSLSGMRVPPSSIWQKLAGSPSYARLPYSAAAGRGCFLILPPDVDGLQLVHESLLEDKAGAWNIAFTTCLEPGDDIGDFHWMGVSAASPLRPQPDSATRPIFDLSTPATLPSPPPPRSETARAKPAEVEAPAIPNPVPSSLSRQPSASLAAADAPPSLSPEWSPQPVVKPQRKAPVLIIGILAALVLLACGTAAAWHLYQKKQAEVALQQTIQSVDLLWFKHGLKFELVASWLKSQQDPRLIQEYQKALEVIQANMAKTSSFATVPLPSKNDPADLFSKLVKHHQAWVDSYSALADSKMVQDWESKLPSEMISEVTPMLEREKRAWNDLAAHFKKPLKPEPPATQPYLDKALTLLSAGSQPRGKPSEWKSLLKSLEAGKQTPAWLDVWESAEKLTRASPVQGAEDLEKRAAEAPAWLVQMIAAKKQDSIAFTTSTVPPPPAPSAPAPPEKEVLPADLVDDPLGSHPIYIVAPDKDSPLIPALASLELPVAENMKIYISSKTAGFKDLKEWTENTTQSSYTEKVFSVGRMADKSQQIVFAGNRLVRIPDTRQNTRVVARSEDGQKLLFEVRIFLEPLEYLLEFNPWPSFIAANANNRISLSGMVPFLQRLHLVAVPSPQYGIRSDTPGSMQKKFFLKLNVSDEYEVISPTTAPARDEFAIDFQTRKKEELEKGIQAERKLRDGLPASLAGREAKIKGYNDAIAAKEAELAEVTKTLDALQNVKIASFTLPPGTYTLMETSKGPRDLCKIEIQSPSAAK